MHVHCICMCYDVYIQVYLVIMAIVLSVIGVLVGFTVHSWCSSCVYISGICLTRVNTTSLLHSTRT